MFITKCPYCQSSDVKKNGIRRGSQFYKCKCCKKQFFNSAPKPPPSIILLVNSIDFYLPHLFTYQNPECEGMPNTNNKIEGTFTDLKKNLNNHSGLTIDHRRLLIIAYFLMRQEVPTN